MVQVLGYTHTLKACWVENDKVHLGVPLEASGQDGSGRSLCRGKQRVKSVVGGKGPGQIGSDIFHLMSYSLRDNLQAGGQPPKSISGSQGPSEASCTEGHQEQWSIHGHLAPESWRQGNRPAGPQRFPPAFWFYNYFSSLLYRVKNHSFDFPWGRENKPALLFTTYSSINSKELTTNCSSLLSRLIGQHFFFLLLMRLFTWSL